MFTTRSLKAMVGIPPVKWLINPNIALFSICLMVVWKGLGWYMVIFLAGLKAIPEEFYEAAQMDGATAWQRYLTLSSGYDPARRLIIISVRHHD